MQNVTLADGTVIRALTTHAERADAVRLQEETWGAGFSEKVPAAILLVSEKTGGVAAGAFSPDGRLVGFIFGLSPAHPFSITTTHILPQRMHLLRHSRQILTTIRQYLEHWERPPRRHD